MLRSTQRGLYCEAGGFYVDPSRSAERAVVTHAHSDHARPGSRMYLTASEGVPVLRARLGARASIRGVPYGECVELDGVRVSFHPAGHILGSAQVRMEHQGEVWVVSGDYKLQADPTCAPFEPVRCHTFVTECTFGLPVYRWPQPQRVFEEVNSWWQGNQQHRRTSVLFAYSLGKAQRLLVSLDPALGPLFASAAVRQMLPAYAQAGVRFPAVEAATAEAVRACGCRGLVITSATSGEWAWLGALDEVTTAEVSGWMLLRGVRQSRRVERGFVLSDHADWPGLVGAIRATGAERVLVTHGAAAPLVRWLREQGWQAEPLEPPVTLPAGTDLEGVSDERRGGSEE